MNETSATSQSGASLLPDGIGALTTVHLVIVALPHEKDDEPDLSTLSAFVATGTQGITYRPGIWHHPMVALDHETDFFCLVYEDGTEADCTEAPLDAPRRVRVEIG